MANQNSLDNLKKVLESVLANIAGTLSVALNHKTEVQLDKIQPVDMEELRADFPDEVIYAQVNFTEGISDHIGFLLLPRWTATWADLMLMGEGQAEFNADEHLDGISELLNQVSGVLCQYLGDLAGSSVKIEPIEATQVKVEDQAESWESFFRTDFIISVEGFDTGSLTILLSPQTVEDIQGLSPAVEEQVEDRPPPVALDEEVESEQTPEVRPTQFEDISPGNGGGTPQSIQVLMDLELPVIIELGRTSMFIRDILELSPGSIVELNKLSGEPVDLFINDKKFAKGEVVIIDENFGIRITDLVKVEDRIHTLK